MNFTSQQVKAFYAAACKQYDAEIVDKNDSRLMKIVAGFLDGIGVVDKESFMRDFTTTLGSIIFVPYTPGVATPQYTLEDQVAVLTHELVHCNQFDDDPVGFMVLYLTSKSARTEYESAAYAADLEFNWWLHKKEYDIKRRASSLLNYGLGQEHADFMEQYLMVQNDVFRQGGEISTVVKWVKEWFSAPIKQTHA